MFFVPFFFFFLLFPFRKLVKVVFQWSSNYEFDFLKIKSHLRMQKASITINLKWNTCLENKLSHHAVVSHQLATKNDLRLHFLLCSSFHIWSIGYTFPALAIVQWWKRQTKEMYWIVTWLFGVVMSNIFLLYETITFKFCGYVSWVSDSRNHCDWQAVG